MRQSGDAGLKVGSSVRPEERAKTLTRDRRAKVKVVHHEFVSHAATVERWAHWFLRDRRISGEWFDVSLDEARTAVRMAISAVANKEPMPWRSQKAPREPRVSGFCIPINMMVNQDFLETVDALRALRRPIPGRAEMIREAVAEMAARELKKKARA